MPIEPAYTPVLLPSSPPLPPAVHDLFNAYGGAYLGAAVAVCLDHIFCPLLHFQLDGQLLLQTSHAAQVGG